ncbi:hypothetical protein PR003_g32122 [Phytophthora rubi]|uniref:RxLR effector protein n=1 Tax=Phytophthora rubi TaxID=129364 RepID=A0A6A3FZF9_9STRA|nr:hypothetical protein PR002_g33148 [Phytophthora rubi]KAE9266448.1 hypothetical protein PR003_g32122 [Phytophthora rubi]
MAACLRACLATSNLVILQSTLLSPPPIEATTRSPFTRPSVLRSTPSDQACPRSKIFARARVRVHVRI